MKSKIVKTLIWIIVIVVAVLVYKSPKVSAWRNYNNGMRAYKENNYQQAAGAFSKAFNIYSNPNLKFNECISEWAGIMKKQDDLKIDSIADSVLSATDKKFLLKSSQKLKDKIIQLLTVHSLKSKQAATLYYALGMLYMLENQPDKASAAFHASVTQQADFKPALKQLVKANAPEAQSAKTQLILGVVDNEHFELMKWKPF